MKTRGFTLIELLAVIVILAIIALIATPVVLNIIKDSSVSTNKISAQNYIDAVNLAISKKMVSESTYKVSGKYYVDVNGNLCKSEDMISNVCKEDKNSSIIKVEFDGDVDFDTGSYIEFDSKGVIIDYELKDTETGEVVKKNANEEESSSEEDSEVPIVEDEEEASENSGTTPMISNEDYPIENN